jgi:catechol 2,3-dioxygenase-like lactoylglutathione lyase family enzyme
MPTAKTARPPIDQQIVFIRTRDFARATRFYEEVIELPLVLDQGTCRIYRVAGDAFLGVCRAQPEQAPAVGGVIMTFVTAEVSQWYQRLLAAGVEIDGAPRDNPNYGIHHFYARDPDGHALEFQRFHAADWATPSGKPS